MDESGSMKSISPEIVNLYELLSQLTHKECKTRCNMLQCCDAAYCEEARKYALKVYGVELEDTGHETLPFMGETGCVVAPHLRPKCTEFLCEIRDRGAILRDQKLTDRYFELRRGILKQRIRDGIGPNDGVYGDE